MLSVDIAAEIFLVCKTYRRFGKPVVCQTDKYIIGSHGGKVFAYIFVHLVHEQHERAAFVVFVVNRAAFIAGAGKRGILVADNVILCRVVLYALLVKARCVFGDKLFVCDTELVRFSVADIIPIRVFRPR